MSRNLTSDFRNRATESMQTLAGLFHLQGKEDHAERVMTRAKALNPSAHQDLVLVPADRQVKVPEGLTAMMALATMYSSRGNHSEALRIAQEVLAKMEAKFGREHPQLVPTLMEYQRMLELAGRGDDAQFVQYRIGRLMELYPM